jgi:hypothetical protein
MILYASNGEVRQEFSIVLTARPLSGRPTPSSESSEVRWVPASEIPGYTMDRSMRIRINDFLSRNQSSVITESSMPAAKTVLTDGQSRSSAAPGQPVPVLHDDHARRRVRQNAPQLRPLPVQPGPGLGHHLAHRMTVHRDPP